MPKLYHSVPHEEAERLNGTGAKSEWTEVEFEQSTLLRTWGRAQKHWAWLAHALLLSISLTLFTLSLCMRTASTAKISDTQVTQQYSTYSPAAPVVRYHTERYKLAPIMVTEYVGYGPKVDEAWDKIANDAADIMVTEEERVKLGWREDILKIQDPRTGKWGYRAAIEVFHQLHCLNLVRQAVYKDYYKMTNDGNDIIDAESTEELDGHVDHCIETLRLNIMCQGDIGLFPFRKFPELVDQGIEGYWPDFETDHVCRDFGAIKKFNNDNWAAWDHDV